MDNRRPYRLNVIGDFYVEDGCCTLCGVPEVIAPDLFEMGEGVEQCYVKKQPTSQDELRRMIDVFATQDLGCIGYKGCDAAVLKELKRVCEEGACDFPPPGLVRELWTWLRGFWLG
jgi:4Fe-4S single cluster protein